MTTFLLRHFTSADIPQVTDLQQAYQRIYPHTNVVPGEVYLSPGFEGGRNISCAFDEQGALRAYAPLFPVLTEAPGLPHTFWTEVKARPDDPAFQEVKEMLLEQIRQRAAEVASACPGHPVHLTFQYHPSESASIDFACAHGGVYTESVFRLYRELTTELPTIPAPAGLQIRRWRLESEADLAAYVAARNEVFPETPVTLADWRAFLTSPAWKDGTQITAFDGPEVVGCVAAYWDEALRQITGREAGYTEYIFVRERWRGRGVAAHLIAQAMAYLKDCGKEAAFLEVKATNENALGLYLRLGYEKVDETRFYVIKM
jgi:ribosomal protein S18 acetylase RimI-like enzyme